MIKNANNFVLSGDHPLYVASTNLDVYESGVITVMNPVVTDTPLDNSYVEIETIGKGSVSIQVSGTWSCATEGLKILASLDGINWVYIDEPYSALKAKNKDFDGEMHSGETGIWTFNVTGYSAIRLMAVGTGFTGAANVTMCANNNTIQYFGNPAGVPYTKTLSTNGDGTGTYNIVGDYSGAPTDFYYQAPVGVKYYLNAVTVTITDTSKFNVDGFGGLAALTNGIEMIYSDLGVEHVLLGGRQIKTNGEWPVVTPYVKLIPFANLSGADLLSVTFKLKELYEIPLILSGDHDRKFIVRVNDDFTGLVTHQYVLHGRIV